MEITKVLNPFYLCSNSSRILSCLRNRLVHCGKSSKKFIVGSRYKLACYGLPLTENERRLAALKDKHQGQRAFIVGNGPSLNKMNLRLLKNEITFSANKIYLFFGQMGFLPTYYAVEDQLLASQSDEEINSVKGTTKLFPEDIKAAGIRADAETIFFHFINNPSSPRFSLNCLDRVHCGGTITYTNMQLAYYMGIREVYLIGMDFDWGEELNKTDGAVVGHGEVTHFCPGYHREGELWNPPCLDRAEKSFLVAKRSFEENGGKIYNATIGGKLEVFERVDYDSLF